MLGEFHFDDDKFVTALSRCFFIAFTLFVLIMMLNLLIAIISDTFERVIERKQAQFTKEQALLLCQTEQHALFGFLIRRWFLSPEQVENGFLHVLRLGKSDAEQSADAWQGRVRGLKDHTTEKVADLEKKVEDEVKELKRQMDENGGELKRQMDEKMEAMNHKIETKMNEILTLLKKSK